MQFQIILEVNWTGSKKVSQKNVKTEEEIHEHLKNLAL